MAKRFIDSIFWTDSKLQSLSVDAKYTMLCLMTGPDNHLCGVHHWTMETICFYTGLPKSRIGFALHELETAGRIKRYVDNWIWVVNQLRHEPSKGPKTLVSAVKKMESIPVETLKKDFFKKYELLFKNGIGYRYGMDTVLDTVHEHEQYYINSLELKLKKIFPVGKNHSLWTKARVHLKFLVSQGVSEDQLLLAASNYAKKFDRSMNYAAHNFYDPAKSLWRDYLDAQEPEKPKPIVNKALEDALEREKQWKESRNHG